jgi:UDP-2,3-diacylglucosamine pyrophosphatase LpxH
MPGRFIILSDLHLGREPQLMRPEMLRPIWRRGDHLIINGDFAEVHDPRYMDAARRMALELEDLCEADGVTLTLLAGNHDPSLTDRRHLFLAGGEVFITHGDAVNPAIAPWCSTAPIVLSAYEEAMASLPVETHASLEARLIATRTAATVKWEKMRHQIGWIGSQALLLRPWAFVQIFAYWMTFPREATRFARQFAPDARFIIMGHTHRQGVWRVGGRTLINTGAYAFPARPRGVIIEGRSLEVVRLSRTPRGFAPHAPPIARFTLRRPA